MDKETIQKACFNPESVFNKPEDVLAQSGLNTAEKFTILKRWEYDARELQLAEKEGMGGGPENKLELVVDALAQLDASED